MHIFTQNVHTRILAHRVPQSPGLAGEQGMEASPLVQKSSRFEATQILGTKSQYSGCVFGWDEGKKKI
jgi:hypothetical protein